VRTGDDQPVGDLLVGQSLAGQGDACSFSPGERQWLRHGDQRGGARTLAGLRQPVGPGRRRVRRPRSCALRIGGGSMRGGVDGGQQVTHLLQLHGSRLQGIAIGRG
jgi:hypothetical protein